MAHHNNSGLLDCVIVGLSWMWSITNMITKDNVSFVLSILVSLAAIAHYVVQIKKNLKR